MSFVAGFGTAVGILLGWRLSTILWWGGDGSYLPNTKERKEIWVREGRRR